jgi:hypothetical protein
MRLLDLVQDGNEHLAVYREVVDLIFYERERGRPFGELHNVRACDG